MENSNEQLIRQVTQVGNGAHVFAPREWLNEKVLIIRLEKKSLKEQIFEKISPYLDKIVAVFLFGSHARKEATLSSDVDLLIISKEPLFFKKEEGWDIVVVPENKIEEAIKINPILMYSIFREAEVIVNPTFLEKLRSKKINRALFKSFIKETEDSIVSSKQIIELDKKTGKYISDSVIYSVILRLRGLFIINSILKNKKFSNKEFKDILTKEGFNFKDYYDIYQSVRKGSMGKDTSLPLSQGDKLILLLEGELKALNKRLK